MKKKKNLPANHLFWEELSDIPLFNDSDFFYIKKYKSSDCVSYRFYKPISRVFKTSFLKKEND